MTSWIWIIYLGLVPVVWLPGIPVSAIAGIKAALIIAGVTTTWFLSTPRDVPHGLVGPFGLALLSFSAIFSMLQADTIPLSLRQLWELFIAFSLLWTFRLFERDVGPFSVVASGAVAIYAALSGLIILSFTGILVLNGPSGIPVHISGFAGARTGWSIGLAVLVPFAVATGLETRVRARGFLLILAAITTMVGQFVVGGRSGLLAAVVGSTIVVFVLRDRKIGAAILAVGLAATYASRTFLIDRLRLNRPSSVTNDFLDRLTTGRITGDQEGLKLIWDRPFQGYGFGKPIVRGGVGGESSIHNVWLRLLAEGGLFLAITSVLVVANIVRLGVRGLRLSLKMSDELRIAPAVGALAAIIAGIIISFFEPAVIIGSMFNASPWWASAGAIVGMQSASHLGSD